MLERVAAGVFHAVAGEAVTLAAVARNNNGVSAAAFRYDSPANLPQRQVQGHPGCTFVVGAGARTLTVSVFFVPDLGSARYELFAEDRDGTLTPLGVTASPATGPVVKVQIDGRPAARRAAPPAPARSPTRTEKVAAKAAQKPVARRTGTAAAKGSRKPVARRTRKAAVKAVRKLTPKDSRRPAATAVRKPAKRASSASRVRTAGKRRRSGR